MTGRKRFKERQEFDELQVKNIEFPMIESSPALRETIFSSTSNASKYKLRKIKGGGFGYIQDVDMEAFYDHSLSLSQSNYSASGELERSPDHGKGSAASSIGLHSRVLSKAIHLPTPLEEKIEHVRVISGTGAPRDEAPVTKRISSTGPLDFLAEIKKLQSKGLVNTARLFEEEERFISGVRMELPPRLRGAPSKRNHDLAATHGPTSLNPQQRALELIKTSSDVSAKGSFDTKESLSGLREMRIEPLYLQNSTLGAVQTPRMAQLLGSAEWSLGAANP